MDDLTVFAALHDGYIHKRFLSIVRLTAEAARALEECELLPSRQLDAKTQAWRQEAPNDAKR